MFLKIKYYSKNSKFLQNAMLQGYMGVYPEICSFDFLMNSMNSFIAVPTFQSFFIRKTSRIITITNTTKPIILNKNAFLPSFSILLIIALRIYKLFPPYTINR